MRGAFYYLFVLFCDDDFFRLAGAVRTKDAYYISAVGKV